MQGLSGRHVDWQVTKDPNPVGMKVVLVCTAHDTSSVTLRTAALGMVWREVLSYMLLAQEIRSVVLLKEDREASLVDFFWRSTRTKTLTMGINAGLLYPNELRLHVSLAMLQSRPSDEHISTSGCVAHGFFLSFLLAYVGTVLGLCFSHNAFATRICEPASQAQETPKRVHSKRAIRASICVTVSV